jgi:threonine/homoserine/homoserine lactone efflux protein
MTNKEDETVEETKEPRTLLDKLGGRKAMAFYATLLVLFILALINKAHAEIISAIDSLFLIFAGSNVMKAKTQQNQEKEKGETNGIQNK